MYAIKGKAQGFVEEDWIVGVKGKPKKSRKFEKELEEDKRHQREMQKAISDDMLSSQGLKWSSKKDVWVNVKTGLSTSEAYLAQHGLYKDKKTGEVKKIAKKKAVKTTKPLKKKKKGVIKGKPTTPKVHYEKKKLPKMPEAIKKALHPKTLTKNQQALLRKYRFVDASIQGKMYHTTKQNVKDGKIEWYRKNGKVCLKNRR